MGMGDYMAAKDAEPDVNYKFARVAEGSSMMAFSCSHLSAASEEEDKP